MGWKFNLPESQTRVYYLVKLIGLAPFTMKGNRFHPPTLLGKLYPVIVAASYFLFVTTTFILKPRDLNTEGYSQLFVVTWSTITQLSSLSTIIITSFIFLWMHQKIAYLMNKLCIVSDELKSLGIEDDHEKFIKNVWKSTVMANAALIAICVVLILMEPHWNIFLSIKHCIDNWFGLNVVLIFVQTLFCIRRYFILVNQKLYDLLVPAPHLRLPHHSRIFGTSVNVSEENQLAGSERLTDLQSVQKIKALHFELYDLVERTTRVFATPIVLNSFRFSTQFMLALYYVYLVFRNPGHFEISSILCTVLRMVMMIALLSIIAHASAITCEQGNATRAVLFKVWIKLRPLSYTELSTMELTDEFLVFSTQLLHTPVTVSAFGFVNLNYSFVVKIFSAVVTYLIIIIQFEA